MHLTEDACLASGLSGKIGNQLGGLAVLPTSLVSVLLMLLVSATTAVASNVATASIFVPVVAGLAGMGSPRHLPSCPYVHA